MTSNRYSIQAAPKPRPTPICAPASTLAAPASSPYLLQNSDGPLRLLEIGSGAGGVHYELLRRGLAASAVAVDASSAYIAAARSVGERLGLDSRVHYVHGDFTAAADTISPADAVILDRVICCYPNLNDLLGASAAKAERFLALSYPREKWWVRLAFNLYNLSLRLKRINFRTYLHRHSDVHSIAIKKRPRAGPRRHPRPLAKSPSSNAPDPPHSSPLSAGSSPSLSSLLFTLSSKMSLRLCHNVHANQFAPRLQQPPRHRADRAVAHRQPVELRRRHDAVRRAREECLFRRVDVIWLKIADLRRDAQLRPPAPAPSHG